MAPNEGLILKLFVRFLEIEFVKSKMHGLTFYKGAFNDYLDRILPFFDPLPLRGQFLCSERGQKHTFFDPLPASSCPRSY